MSDENIIPKGKITEDDFRMILRELCIAGMQGKNVETSVDKAIKKLENLGREK